jgi:hypothetical protein
MLRFSALSFGKNSDWSEQLDPAGSRRKYSPSRSTRTNNSLLEEVEKLRIKNTISYRTFEWLPSRSSNPGNSAPNLLISYSLPSVMATSILPLS